MAGAGGVRMTSRDATAADLPAIDRVFRRSFCDTFAYLYDPKDLDEFLANFTPEAWRGEYEDSLYGFRVAEADESIVGYVKIGPSALPVETDARALELRQLYILAGYHGVGIAHSLMDCAIGEARSRPARELYLTLYVHNHRARRFYDRYGFECAGRYDFMVGSHADEDIIMRKRL
jgi:ribosomal protein S18 acetylase RimI-like enzyme